MARLVIRGNTYLFYCPGCGKLHCVDNTWDFNGNVNYPTLNPSVLYLEHPRCHSFITNGVIEYMTDCDHWLSGRKAMLPEIDL